MPGRTTQPGRDDMKSGSRGGVVVVFPIPVLELARCLSPLLARLRLVARGHLPPLRHRPAEVGSLRVPRHRRRRVLLPMVVERECPLAIRLAIVVARAARLDKAIIQCIFPMASCAMK